MLMLTCTTMMTMMLCECLLRSWLQESSLTNDRDPTKTPGFVVNSLLQSIDLQIRQLKLMSASLQEATPDVEDEMRNVARLVKEAGKFFGSEAALERFSIDPKFAGNQAFVEARYAAGNA